MRNTSLAVHVLFRFSKKTGKVDKVMTGMGSALMQMWTLHNTPKTKVCFIFERETGKLVFAAIGDESGFPRIKKGKECEGKTCEEFGIPLEELHNVSDDRFDTEVV